MLHKQGIMVHNGSFVPGPVITIDTSRAMHLSFAVGGRVDDGGVFLRLKSFKVWLEYMGLGVAEKTDPVDLLPGILNDMEGTYSASRNSGLHVIVAPEPLFASQVTVHASYEVAGPSEVTSGLPGPKLYVELHTISDVADA